MTLVLPLISGMRTVSMTWITPLEATISVLVTCALFTITPPFMVLIVMLWPSTVLAECELHHIVRHHFARHHVIRENALQLGLVFRLQQHFQRTGRQFGEGLIRGREHRERAGTFQRVDQSRGFHRGHQRVEFAGDSGIHDVGRGSGGRSQRERQSACQQNG